MVIQDALKEKIESVIKVFETGSTKSRYDYISVFRDGRKVRGRKTMQITYGKMQTTEQGNLAELIEMYCDKPNAKYASAFDDYIDKIGVTPLSSNESFKRLLVAASYDSAMREAQDDFFDKCYWQPCLRWCENEGFKLPLSLLAIYDSFIHSGSIMSFLRQRFRENTPINKGNEKKWVTEYIKVRDAWLEYHDDALLRKTDYRTDCILEQIRLENWDLSNPITILDGNGKFNAKVV